MTAALKEYRLFKECVETTGAKLLSDLESDRLNELLKQMIPVTEWSKVDWNRVEQKVFVGNNPDGIIPALKQMLKGPLDTSVYIEWSSISYPIIKADLRQIIKHFYDVTCVSYVKFIFNPTIGYLIEVKGSYEITLGLLAKDAILWAQSWYTCLSVLGESIKIYSYEISQRIIKSLKNKFGFGHDLVAWHLIPQQKIITSKHEIVSTIETLLTTSIDETPAYILWHETTLPAVQTTLDNVIKNFDVIKSMGSKIWVFNESAQYVVEITPNEIKIGLRPNRKKV